MCFGHFSISRINDNKDSIVAHTVLAGSALL